MNINEWIVMKRINWNRIPVVYVSDSLLSLHLEKSIWKKFWLIHGIGLLMRGIRHMEFSVEFQTRRKWIVDIADNTRLHPNVWHSAPKIWRLYETFAHLTITSRVLLCLANVAMSAEKREQRDSVINISNLKAVLWLILQSFFLNLFIIA